MKELNLLLRLLLFLLLLLLLLLFLLLFFVAVADFWCLRYVAASCFPCCSIHVHSLKNFFFHFFDLFSFQGKQFFFIFQSVYISEKLLFTRTTKPNSRRDTLPAA